MTLRKEISKSLRKKQKKHEKRSELTKQGLLSRLILIDQLIREGNYPSLMDMATHRDIEVSERSMKRDLAFLRDSIKPGAPIAYDRDHKGYYYTDKSWHFPGVYITEDDVFSLFVAKQAVKQYQGTPMEKHLDAMFKRFTKDYLKTKNKHLIAAISDADLISFQPVATRPIKDGVWQALTRGLTFQQTVRVHYQGWQDDSPKEILIDPYHITNLQGEWYVFAGIEGDIAVHQYTLARMSKAYSTEQHFIVPRNFDPKKLLNNVFGRYASVESLENVKILIKKKLVPLVEDRTWHPQQKIEKKANGDVEISFPVSSSGLWRFFHIKQWVLSFGKEARVLEPESLKKLVAEEIREMGDIAKSSVLC